MIEKSLIIIMFMYASSFALLGMQYTLGDSFGLTLIGADGQPIESNVVDFIQTGTLNTVTGSFASNATDTDTNRNWFTYNPIVQAAGFVFEIFLLLTGTYIFNVLFFVVGIPQIWIAGFVILYFFLLMRTIVAYLRGI